MPHSYTSITVHVVFSTKNRTPQLDRGNCRQDQGIVVEMGTRDVSRSLTLWMATRIRRIQRQPIADGACRGVHRSTEDPSRKDFVS
jgi:hypothetical protein